ncbi:hypothetical protein [Candidatus Stoquefichus sp. SB1]|uniref:hypothetical protein n=1 Tax=Candidatus Stoquefichus sp. SB1 TaxID=1658109 RepID=UPI00067E6599|nr:hypothetical protein [Candidatus Stoquefichus sp. SB1]
MELNIEQLQESLKIRCHQCHGLCCVALYFSKIDGFPENKMAGKPCHYLLENNQCHIYDSLKERKMKGCMIYDCFGAGQIVSQRLPSWRHCENIMEIFEVFQTIMQLQQMLNYLIEAYYLHHNSQLKELILENLKIRENIFNNIKVDLEKYHQKVSQQLKKICQQYTHDMSMKIMIGEDLRGKDCCDYVFLGTDLRDAKVENADLSRSLFLTQIQLNGMIGNRQTKIPPRLERPRRWED